MCTEAKLELEVLVQSFQHADKVSRYTIINALLEAACGLSDNDSALTDHLQSAFETVFEECPEAQPGYEPEEDEDTE